VRLVIGIDTALRHTGVAVLDVDSNTVVDYEKVMPPADITGTAQLVYLLDGIDDIALRNRYPVIWAIEDYFPTSRVTSHRTAELIGALKVYLHISVKDYCMVHPSKTLKYVIKKRKVSKREIIDYVRREFNFRDEPDGLSEKDMSDVCDAVVVAAIGKMVYLHHHDPQVAEGWEPRWKEIVLTDKSGILTKEGLAHFFTQKRGKDIDISA